MGYWTTVANAGLLLPPSLQLSKSPLVPAHPTRMPVSPVHPLYHKLEEGPVIISQKFLVEAAEHLRRSKGGVSSVSAPAATTTPPSPTVP